MRYDVRVLTHRFLDVEGELDVTIMRFETLAVFPDGSQQKLGVGVVREPDARIREYVVEGALEALRRELRRVGAMPWPRRLPIPPAVSGCYMLLDTTG